MDNFEKISTWKKNKKIERFNTWANALVAVVVVTILFALLLNHYK